MNRRNFLKSFGGMIGAGIALTTIPKLVLSPEKPNPLLAPYKARIVELDAGCFYCPYIPLMTSGTSENAQYTSFKTRYISMPSRLNG